MRPIRFASVLVMQDSPKPGGEEKSLNPSKDDLLKSIYFPRNSVERPKFSIVSGPQPAMDLQYILAPVVELSKGRTPSPPPRPPPLHLLPPPVYPLPCPGVATPPGLEPPRERSFVPHPDDVILSFDTTTHTFPRPSKQQNVQSNADPYAENFLRDMIGSDKWDIFSSRLFERRLGLRAKGIKGKGKPGEDDDNRSGVSAIEFLVKVEVVKEVLRTFVPHPYNPLKSLAHTYHAAPSGQVTLTRSTVLALSGWSNTQFSYWARRAEAVSVLGEYDSRLHAVGIALERRLRGDNTIPPNSEAYSVTGKGLDAIIDEVKKRTGKSQFLRGKHSSLDPYGTTATETDQPMYPAPLFAMPTFQADYYNHWVRMPSIRLQDPPSLYPQTIIAPPSAPKKRLFPRPPPYMLDLSETSRAGDSEDSMSSPLMASPSDMPSPVISEVLTLDYDDSSVRSSRVQPSVQSDDVPSYFPLSESRLDLSLDMNNSVNKRKPGEPDTASQKRARTFFNNSSSASDDEFF
ncbi:hypothetical protein Clacol_006396 [Clathrus columnatus]|uniref:Uncharacterized protein n=1 Tax=Clathrus columnatus TaxID=1419009 RepID=A0AAV5AGY5_9AGAM|nr:hypothetical protein Clacol_006396 [Clathrus columnatus]